VTEVILNFDGANIRKFGLHTTYNLSSLSIYDQDSTLLYLSNSDFCYTTNYYKFEEFDEARAILPDLIVTAEYNESVVDYNVCNIGYQIAEDLIVKVIDLDVNQTISSLPILALLPGECIRLRRDTSASQIKIMVDPDNKIPEIDECNNEVTPV
jgi:subtilase family serine protease